jgi:hypothetical protein
MSDIPPDLQSKLDQRIAMLEDAGAFMLRMLDKDVVLVLALTDPPPGITEATYLVWDRTCDRCGKYCPNDRPFYTGSLQTIVLGHVVSFSFGVCQACKWDEPQ